MSSDRPTRMTQTSRSRTASKAPSTSLAGAKSPPIASTAIFIISVPRTRNADHRLRIDSNYEGRTSNQYLRLRNDKEHFVEFAFRNPQSAIGLTLLLWAR